MYPDDITMFSRNWNEHIFPVRTVLSLLQDAGVMLILGQCKFFTGMINHLGHVIRPEKFEFADRTSETIRDLMPMRNPFELKSLLNTYIANWQYVLNFARTADILN